MLLVTLCKGRHLRVWKPETADWAYTNIVGCLMCTQKLACLSACLSSMSVFLNAKKFAMKTQCSCFLEHGVLLNVCFLLLLYRCCDWKYFMCSCLHLYKLAVSWTFHCNSAVVVRNCVVWDASVNNQQAVYLGIYCWLHWWCSLACGWKQGTWAQ